MDLTCEERPSDSPFVKRIWYRSSEQSGDFISIANPYWEMVVTRLHGQLTMTVRGPETKPTPAYCPPDGEWIGIQFNPGTLMPNLPPKMLMDRSDVNLPLATSQSFWLNGSAWQFPDYENADTFVERLVREGLLTHDPLVGAVLQAQSVEVSLRTAQRRFLQATGLTYGAVSQIERARKAAVLLRQGIPILDVVDKAGYADQPHLTRSLKHLLGQTPAQIMDKERSQPMSLLFKT